MVIDHVLLQTSIDNNIPHRILFSGDARIRFPGLGPKLHRDNVLSLFVYLFVFYIFSRDTVQPLVTTVGVSSNETLVTSLAGSLAAHRG